VISARRAARHVAIAAVTCVSGAALYRVIPSPNVARKLTLATAYPGLALLAATLCVGPWYVLRGRRAPVSIGLRRDLGIWAGILAVVHTVVGLRVHFAGDWRRYFLYAPGEGPGFPIRLDAMGWANYIGLAATLLAIGLVALSNDFALRRLGTVRWKSLQRWNYAVFSLVAVHGFMFQAMTRRPLPAVALMVVLVFAGVAVQLLGFRARRRALRGADGEEAVPRQGDVPDLRRGDRRRPAG
jgi:sulfoxide reductase heme-binding subunit YedZ